ESAVGMFMRTVPVRISLAADCDVTSWLTALQSRQALRETYSYVGLPEMLQRIGWSAGTPLFESLLVYENYPVDDTIQRRIGNLTVRAVHVSERPHFP